MLSHHWYYHALQMMMSKKMESTEEEVDKDMERGRSDSDVITIVAGLHPLTEALMKKRLLLKNSVAAMGEKVVDTEEDAMGLSRQHQLQTLQVK